MSFAEHLADISIKRAKVIQDYKMQQVREFMQAKEKRETELMTFLLKNIINLLRMHYIEQH
jgi:hypothetical protein